MNDLRLNKIYSKVFIIAIISAHFSSRLVSVNFEMKTDLVFSALSPSTFKISSAHDRALAIYDRNFSFVFQAAGIHREYAKIKRKNAVEKES